MVKIDRKVTHNSRINQFSAKKTSLVMIILIGFMFLLCVNLVSSFTFDNIKGDLIQNKDTSEYGKVEIKNSMFGWNWFQLGKVMSLELKENTEQCLDTGCSAKQEIIMYEDGILIDDVKFIDLKTNKETSIKSYEIYVNGDLYNGEEVSGYSDGVKYDVELKGKLYPRQSVDWQIKSAGTDWIDEWAVWTSALSVDLISYFNFDETSGTVVEDVYGNSSLYTNQTNWTTGLINNALGFNRTPVGNFAVNNTLLSKNFTDISVSFWFKFPYTCEDAACLNTEYFVSKYPDASNMFLLRRYDHASGRKLNYQFKGTDGALTSVESNQTTWTAGRWYHSVFVWDGGNNVSLYVDGQFNDSHDYTGFFNASRISSTQELFVGGSVFGSSNSSIDELGFWNRTLTEEEISNLYNSAAGISYSAFGLTTLNAPADDSTTTRTVTFSCSSSADNSENNITNISLYHNETGVWTLNQTNTTSHKKNSTSTFEIEFQDYESVEWNCLGCDNSTSSICTYAVTNNTFSIGKLGINSETYNNNTIEGSSETFVINVSTDSLFINTATLTYNNTAYAGNLIRDGFEYLISRTIDIDTITADINMTFNWTFLLDDASTSYSDNHNQSVLALTADDCSAGTITILNYTLRDEDNQSKLDGTNFNTEIEVDVSINSKGTKNEIINFSKTYTATNPAEVCLSVDLGDTEYGLDASVIYTSDNRETEHHYIQNYSLTNTTTDQNISLYNLNSSRSTSFLITYKDATFLPVENALINIQREYVGDGLFRSIEVGKTDADGQTIGHMVKDDVVYTLIVSKQGAVLATFSNIVAWCEDVIAENCQINLNQFDTGIPTEDWDTYQNLDYTLSFDKNTRIVTLVFTTLDGSSAVVSLNTTKSDRWMNDTVCSDIVASSSGTLTCTIPNSYGNVSVMSKVYMNEKLITQANFNIFSDKDDYFGGTTVILLLLLIITLPLMFVTSTVGVVLGIILALVFASGLMIYTNTSWIGVGSSIIWIIIAGIIIIWKIQGRSKT